MKYTDLDINLGFFRNMRETEWLKLFPHWWSETDPLLQAIGKEVETLKAQSIFDLLNVAFKPPVLLWQESVIEPKYTVSKTITNIPLSSEISNIPQTEEEILKKQEQEIEIQAPRYKTWGNITINNLSDILYNLQINFTPTDYIIIYDQIAKDDKVYIDITNHKVFINDTQTTNIKVKNDGLSYFKTRKREEYDINEDLHNEVLKIQISTAKQTESEIDVEVILKDAVFYDEQNIELNSFELIPLKKVELFAYYDFLYNKPYKGWRKVWGKEYSKDTIVIHDMITTHLFTKKFYVEVSYHGLDFPYKIGFPCHKDAEEGSEYHVNNRLDKWGEYFGLKRRIYRENISEEDYPKTFPPYYPFDIEQDYWYYKRMADEYAWNNLAIDQIDVVDTNDNPVLRLHSIDPFIEDLAIHVKSLYPQERENIDYNMYVPISVSQNDAEADYKRSEYTNLFNLLSYNDNKALITLRNYYGFNITGQKNKSKELETFFDLSNLPEDININDIKILVEAESTDNATNKYSNEETGIIIPGISNTKLFKMVQSDSYGLEEKEIEYTLENGIKEIKKLIEVDANIKQSAIIGTFMATKGSYAEIPFKLEENDEQINDITEVYVTYKDIGTQKAEYHIAKNNDDQDISYIRVFVPIASDYSSMIISCKSENHQSFTSKKIELINLQQDDKPEAILGPIIDKTEDIINTKERFKFKQQIIKVDDEWHTGDFRNLLYQDGIKFINVFQNDDITNNPTILIKNIRLKISYSKKATNYELNTRIINYTDKDKGIVGQLEITVTNQSDKYINPQVDTVCVENLKLQLNEETPKPYCSFKSSLNIGEEDKKILNIYSTKPIIDGKYEILTTSEDKVSRNYIYLFSEGLIKTKVVLPQHFALYNKDITLTAEIINQKQSEMNEEDGKVLFYIDDYLVGSSDIRKTLVNNKWKNIATVTVKPEDKEYLSSGILKIEARYSGSDKYASSRNYNFILISQNDVGMEFIDFQDSAAYGKPYTATVHISYIDEEGNQQLLNIGSERQLINFYIDDEFLGSSEIDSQGNAQFIINQLQYPAGTHTITAEYEGTEAYVNQKITKEFKIYGGPTTTTVFDITAKQQDTIKLIARITDTNNEGVTQGIAEFYLKGEDEEEPNKKGEVEVTKGQATIEYTIPDTLLNDDPDDEYIYEIIVKYRDEEEIYEPSEGTGKLLIKREEVIIEGAKYFYVSLYEPLGFYLKITDLNGNPIQGGKIQLSIPDQPIIGDYIFPDEIDEDGGARLLYYPINFDSKDFSRLLKTHFIQQTGEQIYPDYTPEENNPDSMEIIDKDLICIYSGMDITRDDILAIHDTEEFIDSSYNIMRELLIDLINDETVRKYLPWFHIQGDDLYITTKNNEDFDQVVIGHNGSLYVRSDTLEKLEQTQYKTGVFEGTFTYLQNEQYKTTTKDVHISFKQGTYDTAIMAYDVRYGDNDSFKCYISDYHTGVNIPGEHEYPEGYGKRYVPVTKIDEDDPREIEEIVESVPINKNIEYHGENVAIQNGIFRSIGKWFNGYLDYTWKNDGLWCIEFMGTLGGQSNGFIPHRFFNLCDQRKVNDYQGIRIYDSGAILVHDGENFNTVGQTGINWNYYGGIGNFTIQAYYCIKKIDDTHFSVYIEDIDDRYKYLAKEIICEYPEMPNIEQFNLGMDCLYSNTWFDSITPHSASITGAISKKYVYEIGKEYPGTVAFYIDDKKISTEEVNGDIAELPLTVLQNISMGNHLLHTEYIPGRPATNTHTYNRIIFNAIESGLLIEIDRLVPGKLSKVTVTVRTLTDQDIRISGQLDLFLNGEKIASSYLLGIEEDTPIINTLDDGTEMIIGHTSSFIFEITMPEDLGLVPYNLTAEYSGNQYIGPASGCYISPISGECELDRIPVDLTIKAKDHLTVARGEKAILKVELESDFDDYINEGSIVIKHGSNNIITKQAVKNNIAYIEWDINSENDSIEYSIEYVDSDNYIAVPKLLSVSIIEPQDEVWISQIMNKPFYFDNFEEAQRCVKSGGKIHIVDSFVIENNIIINKDINILGTNSSKIIKDANAILKTDSIKIHNFSEFDETLYNVVGLTLDDVTDLNFFVENEELFIKNKNTIIPIFLLEDGEFYSYKNISSSVIKSIINITIEQGNNVYIDNVFFETNDSGENNFEIINRGNLEIKKAIINKDVVIKNSGKLKVNESLVYGEIIGLAKDMNLDNNWWGTNNPKRKELNNYIILELDTTTTPIIGEDIEISVHFIGKNGITYDLPPQDFNFVSQSGYFSIPSGQLVDGYAKTTYIDGDQEEIIYCEVDDERVGIQIYDYDHKTEVIITSATEVPQNQQITFKAQIQSCADTFYKLKDGYLNTTKDINNGYAHFYIKNINDNEYKKMGKVLVKKGKAELPVLLSEQQENYSLGKHILKVEYEPTEYYFKSESEIKFEIINQNNVCYVSQQGNDNNNGSFAEPFATIQKAVDNDKQIIYIKSGTYQVNEISINKIKEIKRYDEDVIFENNNNIIFNTTKPLTLQGLTFQNNNSQIIQSIDNLTIKECIFYNNDTTLLINNTGNTEIERSVFYKNNNIIQSGANCKFNINWFGTNYPEYDVDNYVIMKIDQSKDTILMNSVVRLTACLSHYIDNDKTYKIEEPLPLRIANFISNLGSLMPIKDYTHNNKSTTLFNTREESNSDMVILSLPENKNYIGQPLILKCFIEDTFGNKLDNEDIIFYLNGEKRIIKSQNGVATLNSTIHNIHLSKGEHKLECVYNGKNNIKVSQTFTIQGLDINVKELTIDEGDHLTDLSFSLSLIDSFNQPIEKQSINIYIDNVFIKEEIVKNGKIDTNLLYNRLSLGSHKLTFKTTNESDYEYFEYSTNFNVTKKDTIIRFNHNSIAPGYHKNLIVNVVDKKDGLVPEGTIKVAIDNVIKYGEDEPLVVENGTVILEDFHIDEVGQHSVVIYYNGTRYYNSSVCPINNFLVGVMPINIESNKELNFNLNEELKLSFSIYDDIGQPINRGRINLFIDGINFNDTPINVDLNGYAKYTSILPNEIQPRTHTLTVVYNDGADNTIYAETSKDFSLTVLPIKTFMEIPDSITAHPREKININAKVLYINNETSYSVDKGKLIVKCNNKIVGNKIFNGANPDNIEIELPQLEEGYYNLIFEYEDLTNTYQEKIETTYIEINKSLVSIEINPTKYYPNTYFDLKATFKDDQNNNIEEGECILYINNVQYKNAVNIVNGKAIFNNMSFNKVQDYKLLLVFQENEYYKESKKEQIFKIKDIPINDIEIIGELNSKPLEENEIGIKITDEYNNKVTDGYLDLYINNIHIDTYLVSENDIDYIKIHTPEINKGEYLLKIIFHNSTIYEDETFEFDYTINEPDLHIYIEPDPIQTKFDGTIEFNVCVEERINGTLEFYLCLDEDTERFIGIDQINKRDTIPFSYELPELEKSEYIIKVRMLENDEYNEHIITANLIIDKISIDGAALSNIENPIYQENIMIYGELDINYNNNIDFYIDEEFFETIQASNGNFTLDKQLDSKFNVNDPNNPHKLQIHVDDTIKINGFDQYVEFNILPRNPILPITSIEEYIDNNISLPTYLLDGYGNQISSNTSIQYYDKDKNPLQVMSDGINKKTKVLPNMEKILITCDIDDDNFNNITIDNPLEIEIIANKNIIKTEIDNTGPITRGTPFEENITITSTSSYIPELKIKFEEDNYTFEENPLTIIPSTTLSDKEYYLLTISVDSNEKVEAYEKTFKIYNKNQEEADVTNDLQKAFDLVADYGTINLTEDINSNTQIEIINNKHITINGNNHSISKINIVNNGSLVINDLTIKNSDTSAINTNGELFAYRCKFENNHGDYGGAIYINNKNKSTVIKECCFNQNDASVYGGAIFSNKGNDIILQGNYFINNGHENISGASISVNGNMYLSRNMFYDNVGNSEIHIINGVLEAENNYFDGKLTYNIDNSLNKDVKCDLNYWGYNDEANIGNKLLNIEYNSYLVGRCIVDYTEPQLEQIKMHITPKIDKYRMKNEDETVTSETIIGNVPVLLKTDKENINIKLNEEYVIDKQNIKVFIGQEEFLLGDN